MAMRSSVGSPDIKSSLVIEAHPVQQILETRVIPHWIEVWMHFEELQNIGMFLIRSLEPDERFVIIAQPEIGIDERSGRYVAGFSTLL